MKEADKNFGSLARQILDGSLDETISVDNIKSSGVLYNTSERIARDKKFVYVLQADSTLKHTEIQVSNLNDGKNYIVTGGLKEGDKVVVEGVQTLQDGQKIVPITVAQKEAKYQKALQDQRDGNIQTAFN
jgi:membrane fusion protein (multidrug efflux system)